MGQLGVKIQIVHMLPNKIIHDNIHAFQQALEFRDHTRLIQRSY
uniref:Uncharacterized protein n=1 Tax=Arundo donax TaxID=35708 RepID=A0A0A9GZ28_ARUDO